MKRALEQRAPKLEENTKTAVFIRGGHTSEMVTQALKDFVSHFILVLVPRLPIKARGGLGTRLLVPGY